METGTETARFEFGGASYGRKLLGPNEGGCDGCAFDTAPFMTLGCVSVHRAGHRCWGQVEGRAREYIWLKDETP